MIFSTRQIYLMRLGKPVIPANFGGDGGSSDSSTNTTNKTDNYAQSIDKRNVASDQAVALSGDGSSITKNDSTTTNTSTTNTTSMSDSSNRSTTDITSMIDKSVRDNSTHFSDSSTTDNSTFFNDSSVRDSSTKFSDSSVKTDSHDTSMFDASTKNSVDSHNTSMVDNSNRSVSYSSTDYGSVGKALDSLGQMSSKALDVTAGGVNGAIDTLKYLADENQKSVALAFNMAAASGANAKQNSASVLGFANSMVKETADAFAAAKDGGESKNIQYALAAVAAVGIAFALR